jgi:predicted RNA-binding Zn-ribbon protein involved in translation (DUF1610 family)
MGLKVQHECPQCGAQVQLEDSDRVLICSYCGVASLLHTSQYYRFKLPVHHPGDDLQWIPYLHFKGSAFLIENGEVAERVLQVSAPGAPCIHLPPSLGYRAQTQKLRFVTADDEGEFVRFSLKPNDLLKNALVVAGASKHGHVAFIGETASVIYLPLTRTNESLMDAVTGQPLLSIPQLDPPLVEPPVGDLSFTPAMCPRCGASLQTSSAAVAFPCTNCDGVWESVSGRLVLRASISFCNTANQGLVYLPFWSFQVNRGAPTTWGELSDTTGQPLARRQPCGDVWRFWCPAFKVRPRVLLRLAERLSLTPMWPASAFDTPDTSALPRHHRHAVTLPSREAAEMLPVVIASMAFTVADRPGLFESQPVLHEPVLAFVAFESIGQDLVNQSLSLSISQASLGFGETL